MSHGTQREPDRSAIELEAPFPVVTSRRGTGGRSRCWAAAVLVFIGMGLQHAVAQGCVGDCNGDGTVTISELLVGVNIALGYADPSTCEAFTNSAGVVDISQLIAGVNSALVGCVPGCRSNADCTDTDFPNCGPDGNCWSMPCSTICPGDTGCCGGNSPYCGPDGTSCWNAPCSTLCGDTCCGPTEQCQTDMCVATGPTPTPVANGCRSTADCTSKDFPYCGPDGNCWSQPCSTICPGGESCCGGNFPYCGPDETSCWSAPCATLCGDTCCGPGQTCQQNTSCSS